MYARRRARELERGDVTEFLFYSPMAEFLFVTLMSGLAGFSA